MIRRILLFAVTLLLVNLAKAQNPDTVITYFRADLDGLQKVGALDSADFFRMILPPDSGDTQYNVREYYKDGSKKLIGKCAENYRFSDKVRLSGRCVTYYSNGKKKKISNYISGNLDDMEYEYYMDGNLYCARKHTYDRRADFTKTELWECYNNKGEQICKEGNGEWIIFEDAQKDTLRGPIKNGVMDGEWHGVTHVNRRIEYISKFDKGRFVSGTSYFKGNAYPFTKYVESAEFEKGPLVFIDILRSKVVLPRDSNGRKESFKNISLSFIIEKDGSFSEVKTINTLTELSNDINPKLNEALIAGLMKCKGWSPRKYYGIPLRTKIIYPLEYFHGYVDDRYSKSMTFKEQLIGISDL